MQQKKKLLKRLSNALVKKVNAIDTSGFVKKTDHDNKISDVKGKINLLLV